MALDRAITPPILESGYYRGSSRVLTDLLPDPLPTLTEMEAAMIAEALRRADGNQRVAAGLLGSHGKH